MREQNCKPGSVSSGHLSGRAVADALKPPPGSGRADHALPSHGVASDRVYSNERFPVIECALTALFHPCRTNPAVYLCCTFPEVAFGGRYPLSLPCEARTFLMNGLSACPRDRLFSSHGHFTTPSAALSIPKIAWGGKRAQSPRPRPTHTLD